MRVCIPWARLGVLVELFGVLNLFANFMPALGAVIKKVCTKSAQLGTALHLRTTTSQKCAAVPRRTRI